MNNEAFDSTMDGTKLSDEKIIIDEKSWEKVCDFEEMFETKQPQEQSTKRKVLEYLKSCCTKEILKSSLYANFPFINVLRDYNVFKDLPSDIISGLTVGIMQIPQGMAYALLASLPPICGLYTSFFGPLIYFFTATSRHASMGTIAIVGLMIASALDTSIGKDTAYMDSNSTNISSARIYGTGGITEHEAKKN